MFQDALRVVRLSVHVFRDVTGLCIGCKGQGLRRGS